MSKAHVMLSPSKITAWLECEHYLTLKTKDELLTKKGTKKKQSLSQKPDPGFVTPPEDFADMLRKKGDLHEQRC